MYTPVKLSIKNLLSHRHTEYEFVDGMKHAVGNILADEQLPAFGRTLDGFPSSAFGIGAELVGDPRGLTQVHGSQ